MSKPIVHDSEFGKLNVLRTRTSQLERRPAPDSGGKFQVRLCGNDETYDNTEQPESICIPPDLVGMALLTCSACIHTAASGDVTIMLAKDDAGSIPLLTGFLTIPAGDLCSGDQSAVVDLTADVFADCEEIVILVDDASDSLGMKVSVAIGQRTA